MPATNFEQQLHHTASKLPTAGTGAVAKAVRGKFGGVLRELSLSLSGADKRATFFKGQLPLRCALLYRDSATLYSGVYKGVFVVLYSPSKGNPTPEQVRLHLEKLYRAQLELRGKELVKPKTLEGYLEVLAQDVLADVCSVPEELTFSAKRLLHKTLGGQRVLLGEIVQLGAP